MNNYILSMTKKFDCFFRHIEISNIIYLHDEEDNERLDHVIFLEQNNDDVVGIFTRGMNPLISTNRFSDLDDFNLFASYDGLIEIKDKILFKVEHIYLFFSVKYNELLGVFITNANESTSLFILFLHDQIDVRKGCTRSDLSKIISHTYSNNDFITFEKKGVGWWKEIHM